MKSVILKSPANSSATSRNRKGGLMTVNARVAIALCLIVATITLGQAPTPGTNRQTDQDWPFGPYRVAENWPKPLPDTRHSHDGWTWGSMGSVYAETPDR